MRSRVAELDLERKSQMQTTSSPTVPISANRRIYAALPEGHDLSEKPPDQKNNSEADEIQNGEGAKYDKRLFHRSSYGCPASCG